jgi:hypothetical protein
MAAMRRITDLIREHALSVAGVNDRNKMPCIEELRATEWNQKFEILMRNRLIMGAFRYGLFREKLAGNHGWDLVGYLQSKVDDYKKSGNMESLVDAANMALLEFTAPTHPNAHWGPQDDSSHCSRK